MPDDERQIIEDTMTFLNQNKGQEDERIQFLLRTIEGAILCLNNNYPTMGLAFLRASLDKFNENNKSN